MSEIRRLLATIVAARFDQAMLEVFGSNLGRRLD
jgi:hypothetical protein